MATIHITEIQRLLAERGQRDAEPHAPGGYFLELRFDDLSRGRPAPKADFVNRTIQAESAYGTVLIIFDSSGLLKSVEFC